MIIIFGFDLITFIVIVLIVLFINIIMYVIYKNEPKIDKGLVIPYHKMTYRRKMIRSLWVLPFIIICLYILFKLEATSNDVYIIIASIITIGQVGQIVYNFLKWKKYEQNRL